jgi:hypothetical protein
MVANIKGEASSEEKSVARSMAGLRLSAAPVFSDAVARNEVEPEIHRPTEPPARAEVLTIVATSINRAYARCLVFFGSIG